MSGMTAMGASNSSDYDSRTVLIEVNGLCCQEISRTSNYQVKIPHSRMMPTIRNITRMGGKIGKITVISGGSPQSESGEGNE